MRFRPLSLIAAVTALALASPPAAATAQTDRAFTPRTVTGTVTQIRHADELTLGTLHIRLEGIAAPRLGKPLGAEAVFHMNGIAFRKRVVCRLTGGRFGDAEVGTCRVNGKDLARSLIRAGLARSCPRLGLRRYGFYENAARNTGIAQVFSLPAYCGADPRRTHPNAAP